MLKSTKKLVVFHVTRVWKGEVGETFEMPAVPETTACIGFWPSFLKEGIDLLVYASRALAITGNREYYTSICTRTGLAIKFKDFQATGRREVARSKFKVSLLSASVRVIVDAGRQPQGRSHE